MVLRGYLRGILEAAAQTGYNVTLYTQKMDERLTRDPGTVIRSREVDAVLLVGSRATSQQTDGLLATGSPSPSWVSPTGINTVYIDNEAELAPPPSTSITGPPQDVWFVYTVMTQRVSNVADSGAMQAL